MPAASPTRSNLSPSRLPGLDGLRVGAMALVVAGHAAHAGLVPKGLLWRIENAGTTVFLVLSGFLVTLLLLREVDRTGHIDLGRFLIKRAARLMPSYLAMVACAALLGLAGAIELDWADVRSALLLVTDYGVSGWTLGHTWSVAAEWKFYLLWPAAVLFGTPAARLGLALLLAALPLAVRALPALCGCDAVAGLSGLEVRGDAIAWGCLAAMAYHHRRAALPVRLLGWAGAALWLEAAAIVPHPLRSAASLALMAAGTACLVLFIVQTPTARLTRLLDAAPLRQAGCWTYAVFLWQQFFFDVRHPLPLAAILVGLPAAALASHYAIERPLQQRARHRLRRARPQAVGDMAQQPAAALHGA